MEGPPLERCRNRGCRASRFFGSAQKPRACVYFMTKQERAGLERAPGGTNSTDSHLQCCCQYFLPLLELPRPRSTADVAITFWCGGLQRLPEPANSINHCDGSAARKVGCAADHTRLPQGPGLQGQMEGVQLNLSCHVPSSLLLPRSPAQGRTAKTELPQALSPPPRATRSNSCSVGYTYVKVYPGGRNKMRREQPGVSIFPQA